MKIIQIGTFPIDINVIKGGVEASIYGLTTELCKNHDVAVIDIPHFENKNDFTEENSDFSVFRFSTKRNNNYSAIFRVKDILKVIKKTNPDICHIHTTSLFALFLFISLRKNHIASIITVHGLAHIEKGNAFRKKRNFTNFAKYIIQSVTEFFLLSICKLIIVDTQYVENEIQNYKKQLKIFKTPIIKVIPQGINPIYFDLNRCEEQLNLIAVGALNQRKGYLQLINSFRIVKNEFPNVSLIIAGVVSDKTYYNSLLQQISDLNLESNIHIFPNLPFEKILNLYENASIFVLHSEEESQGIVFCEAMAVGLPIVATNVGGIPWIIENERNGLLSEFGDVMKFSNNILKLINNVNLRAEMGEINLQNSLKFNWTNISNEIIKQYILTIQLS